MKQPQNFLPANNPVVFTITGSTGTTYFKSSIFESTSNTKIFTGTYFPTPNHPTYARVNFTNQLSALVKSDVDNKDSLIIQKPKNTLKYKIENVEYGLTTGSTIEVITATTTNDFHVFEADLDIQDFTTYNEYDYIYTGGTPTKFLTYQKNNKVVNDYSFEQLYYIQSGYTGVTMNVTVGNTSYYFPITGDPIDFGVKDQRQDGQTNFKFSFSGTPVVGTIVEVILYYDVTQTPVVFTSTALSGWGIIDICNDLINSINSDLRFSASLYNHGVSVECFDDLDGLVTIQGANTKPLKPMLRLQVSPKKLQQSGVILSGVNNYSVKLIDNNNNQISETRTYKIVEPICTWEILNLLYTNSLGGVDSIQLLNPQGSLSINKTTIKHNNINLDSDDVYITNGKFNVVEQTIASYNKYSFKAYTQPLTDSDAEYLTELVKSKEHYVELSNGELIPVQLKNNNYNIQKRKYTNQINQYLFEFDFSEGFIPTINKKITIN